MDIHTTRILGQRGFGLLEILISIVMLGLVGSSTFYFLNGQNAASTVGTDITKGTLLGKRKLDSLRVTSYGSVSAGCDTIGNRYIRRWYITTDLVADKKTVELLISWPLAATHTITFNTVVADDQYKVY